MVLPEPQLERNPALLPPEPQSSCSNHPLCADEPASRPRAHWSHPDQTPTTLPHSNTRGCGVRRALVRRNWRFHSGQILLDEARHWWSASAQLLNHHRANPTPPAADAKQIPCLVQQITRRSKDEVNQYQWPQQAVASMPPTPVLAGSG